MPADQTSWLARTVEQLVAKVEQLSLSVERLPTREELNAQLTSKVDVPSYTIAHHALEEAVRQHTQLITTCQQAITATSTTLQTELSKSLGDRAMLIEKHVELVADVEANKKELQSDIESLQQAPQRFRSSATFYLLVSGFVTTTLCSAASLILSLIGLWMHATGH